MARFNRFLVSPDSQPGVLTMLLLLAAATLLAFLFQGSRGLWRPDESCYVGAAYTMLTEQEYLVPRIGNSIYLQKPPVTYWAIFTSLSIFGESEFSVRLFHSICYMVTAAIVYLLGRSVFSDRWYGVVAAAVYMMMAIPFIAASYVTADTPLTVMTTLAMLFFWLSVSGKQSRRKLWQLLTSAAVGLGFMCKGPAALIPCAGMFAYLVARRQVMQYFRSPWSIVCFVIFGVTGLSWYAVVACRVPGALKRAVPCSVVTPIFSRFVSRRFGMRSVKVRLKAIIFAQSRDTSLLRNPLSCIRSDQSNASVTATSIFFGSHPRSAHVPP